MLMAISRRSYKLHYETSQSEVFASKTAENLLRVHSKSESPSHQYIKKKGPINKIHTHDITAYEYGSITNIKRVGRIKRIRFEPMTFRSQSEHATAALSPE